MQFGHLNARIEEIQKQKRKDCFVASWIRQAASAIKKIERSRGQDQEFNFECAEFEVERCPAGINQGQEPQLSMPSYNYSHSQHKCIMITAIFPKVYQLYFNKLKENINRKQFQPYRNFKNVCLVCQHMHIFLFPNLCTTSLLCSFFQGLLASFLYVFNEFLQALGPRIVYQCI